MVQSLHLKQIIILFFYLQTCLNKKLVPTLNLNISATYGSQTFCEFSDMITCPSACAALTGTEALLSLCASWLTSRTNKHEKKKKKRCRQLFFFIQFFITILSYNWAGFLIIFIALSCSAPTNYSKYVFIDIYRLIQYAIQFCRVLATFLLCTFLKRSGNFQHVASGSSSN